MTPDARRQPSAGMRRHEVAERPRLVRQGPALLKQPAVLVAVGEEPEEQADDRPDQPVAGRHRRGAAQELRMQFLAIQAYTRRAIRRAPGSAKSAASQPSPRMRRSRSGT